MKVLSETELSTSATSYRIEVDDEDLRVEETSEERFRRYLKQLREAQLSHRDPPKDHPSQVRRS